MSGRLAGAASALALLLAGCANDGSTGAGGDGQLLTAATLGDSPSTTASPLPTGPTTTFSPATSPPPTRPLPSLPSLPPPTFGFGTAATETTAPPPQTPPVTLDASTHLRPPGDGVLPDQVVESPASFCAQFDSPGWVVEQCEFAGRLHAIVERSLADGHLRVQVIGETAEPGVWRPLLATEDLDGRRWAEAVVLSADADGDGTLEVWIGYRTTANRFDVDIVVPRRDGSLGRVADHGLVNGRVVIVPGGADTYEPVFLSGDQPCCPTGGAARRSVRVDGGTWRATVLPPLPPGSPIPFSSFDVIAGD